ncbi:MAG: phytanoyl-CoA dioxygenase [Candidatus Latescibacteria bacterium]|nr:phytanoyl-CoA dioxygenase [Candidatus Latescibacterota bacterium]
MPALTPEQLDHFDDQGYVVVPQAINPVKALEPVIAEYAQVLDTLATQLHQDGTIASTYSDLPFGDRYIKICVETEKVYNQYFDFSLPFQNVQPDTPFWAGPAVFGALTDADLLDAVESLIGPEIYSNPVQHVRIKPPEQLLPKNQYGNAILGATHWHQDHGVVTPEADDTRMLTVWFSLEDTALDKGPLQVVPQSHRNGLLPHCPNYMGNGQKFAGGSQIPEKAFAAARALPLPVQRGDVVFLHKQTVHGSLSNTSDQVRFSFDLRYNPSDQPTGRIAFPGFVARSRRDPDSELRDPAQWHRLWLETRQRMAQINQDGQIDVPFRRPHTEHALCA